ncbi:MAG: hypothetical protein ACHBN1_33915 [Heteroscytonema crispum UTEX LB 1556]
MPEESPVNVNSQGNVIVVAGNDLNNPGVLGQFSGDVANVVNDTVAAKQASAAGVRGLMSELHGKSEDNAEADTPEQMRDVEYIEKDHVRQLMSATTEEVLPQTSFQQEPALQDSDDNPF